MKDTALVYMLAGLSSRFGGKQKALARVGPNNETLLEHSLNQALKSDFTKIIFVVSKLTEGPLKDLFGSSFKGIPIHYAIQELDNSTRDKPWGTVDCLYSAKHLLDSNFVICNGDDIYGEDPFNLIVNHLKDKGTPVTVGYKLGKVISDNQGVNRGIFKVQDNKVSSIEEIFDISKSNLEEKNLSEEDLCSMNVFGLTPEALEYLGEILENFKEKHKGDRKIECLLPLELGNLIEKSKISIDIYPTNSNWFGITYPEDEQKVQEQIKKLYKKIIK